jgi:molybdopterin-containing oxidoreductase family iron-sulfur binding subunit
MNQDTPSAPTTGAPLTGPSYWRSLDELADTPAFRDWVERQFPRSVRELMEGGVDRRRFLQVMAASFGLAGLGGLSGCRRPELKALPYTKPPEAVVPGLPTFYATAMPRAGWAAPVLVECHEGRPTKIEGNPRHPDSGGSSDVFAQASVLDLYDPDRSTTVLRKGGPATWAEFDAFAAAHIENLRSRRGRGLYVLSGDVVSPSLDLLRGQLLAAMPESRWHVHEPIDTAAARAGAVMAFGSPVATRYKFETADVVLSLDADVLGIEDGGGRHVRGFAEGRRPEGPAPTMNRLYVVESRYSLTGGMADHRLRLPSSRVRDLAVALAHAVLAADPVVPAPGSPGAALRGALEGFRPSVRLDPRWVSEVAADLRAHAGTSLVVAGRRQPALVHALAHALNAALGNLGTTVELRDAPKEADVGTLAELAKAIGEGWVDTLLILGPNPAYDAPADLDFGRLLTRVATTIRLGSHVDETSRLATWHLPAAHYLESWGDARTGDGTVVPIQPVIEPLFGGRTALETLARLIPFEQTSSYDIVRLSLARARGITTADLDPVWQRFLHDGLLAGSARAPVNPALRWGAVAEAVAAAGPAPGPLSASNLELVLDRDAKVDDGRYANNGWLQEVPDPVTKLTWDNAALLSPRTARELGVASGDLVRLEIAGRSLEIAALVVPGQADDSVAVSLGYGRTDAGRVGRGVGFNAYALRTTADPDIAVGLKVVPIGRSYPLSVTQDHFRMEGRDLVREQAFGLPGQAAHQAEYQSKAVDIQTRPELGGEHQWGMVIDLNACVGCNACTVACQSENNIPIVGKAEVARGREMHWIRIDRYFSGREDDPGLVHQPVACVQCESAPCEVVCPVNATVHSDEGLNVQVYSRCIGTRYCLNNCPYKVRRFNFFNYNERPLDQLGIGPLAEKGMAETLRMQKNPDVTVRIRGVMEKCTYCVQRIERAKIGARVDAGATGGTAVLDGTIVPACAQACPARAIVFGDLSDPDSRVSRLRSGPRNYAVLGELNTRPRTTYLARVRNPNPRMPAPAPAGELP